jgi:hypothetical protein
LVELHTSPQPPQLRASVLVLTSHPLAALPSQLPKPALQLASVQAPAAQPAVALLSAHARPHDPQWAALVAVSTQAPAQSVEPAAQVAWHAPLAHTCVPVHGVRQAPQLAESSRVLVSQPLAALESLLPVPVTQPVMPHTPAVHTPPPGHTAPVHASRHAPAAQ